MTNSQRLATVRACLRGWLTQQCPPCHDIASDHGIVEGQSSQKNTQHFQLRFGGTEDESANTILRESILIRDDFYVGRRFHAANHHAVWFIEEDELKIYQSETGELACVFSAEEISAVATSAATEETDTADHDKAADVTDQAVAPTLIQMPQPAASEEDSDGETRRAA